MAFTQLFIYFFISLVFIFPTLVLLVREIILYVYITVESVENPNGGEIRGSKQIPFYIHSAAVYLMNKQTNKKLFFSGTKSCSGKTDHKNRRKKNRKDHRLQ